MVTIRARLLLGYGYMMVLLLLTAGSAAFGFYTISEAIDRILSENFASVAASVEILDALEHQNRVTMEALLAQDADLEELFEADERLEAALQEAKDNVTIEGEEELLTKLREDFQYYVEVRNGVIAAELQEMPLEALASQIFPPFLEVRQGAGELMRLNHEAIIEADREARETALQSAGWLGFLVTLALISMVWLARALQREILSRLSEITDVAGSLTTGDHSRRFESNFNDELGIVCRELNAALDAQDELQAEARGRLNQQKQLVLGVLEEIDGALLLLGLDGRMIAASCAEFETAHLEKVRSWLVEKRPEVLKRFREDHEEIELRVDLGGGPLRIRLLAAEGRRPVGWLIQVRQEGDTEPTPEEPDREETNRES